MAKKLCIVNDMFGTLKNTDIFITDGDSVQSLGQVTLSNIIDTVFGLAGDPNKEIDEIDLVGNNDFMSKIAGEISTGLKQFYNNKNVRVCLNGQICN